MMFGHIRRKVFEVFDKLIILSPSAGPGRGINCCKTLGQMVLSDLQETVQTEK